MLKYFKIIVYLLQQEVYPMFLEELDSKHFYTTHILEKERYIYLIHCIVYTRLCRSKEDSLNICNGGSPGTPSSFCDD
jgi:uncharacterized protein YqgQ